MFSGNGVDELIARLTKEYEKRTQASRKAHLEATRHLPLGVGSNIRAYKPYPMIVARARGTRLTDLDGNQILDFGMGFGALVTGHCHPMLVEELKAQVEEGVMHSFAHEYEARMARELKRRFPIEMVRFSNSGNEATGHAVRLARGFTGRDLIVKTEGAYHGSTDSLLVSWDPPLDKVGPEMEPTPVVSSEGIPRGIWGNTVAAPFNNLEAMEGLFKKRGEEIAGVIVEPVMLNAGVVLPEDGYLKEVEGLCKEHGALFIVDEVKTGCRIAPGGATEYYRLSPDIIVFGKAIGNGIPLSAFGSSEEIMQFIAAKRVVHAGTYNTTPLAMRSGYVTLAKILNQEAYKKMASVQAVLEGGYRDLIDDHKLVAHVQTIAPMGSLYFTSKPVRNYRDYMRTDRNRWYAYWLGMLARGVLAHPPGPDEQWNICVQHTREDAEAHLEALDSVLGEISRAG